jgi:nucleoside 2-deoxyribosyltransferase
MKNIKIYLAGTIYTTSIDRYWKIEFIKQLTSSYQKVGMDVEYEFFDPDPQNEPEIYMIARDKAEISLCDIFVAYIQRPTFGTSMEIMYASLLNTKPILVINPNKKYTNDLWLKGHAHLICDSIETCASHILTMRF